MLLLRRALPFTFLLIIVLLAMTYVLANAESSNTPAIKSLETIVRLPNGNIVHEDIIYTSDTNESAILSSLDTNVSEYAVTGVKFTNIPATFFYNPAGEKTSGDKVVDGFYEWNGITDNFSYLYSGTTTLGASQCETGSDGQSTVAWGVIGIPNVLGISCWGFGNECDIKLSVSDWNWASIAKGVAAHESGHCLGLGHSDVGNAIMYPLYHSQPALDQDDINGLLSIYGGTLENTPTPTSTYTPSPTLVQPSATSTRSATPTPTRGLPTVTPIATSTRSPTGTVTRTSTATRTATAGKCRFKFCAYAPGAARN